LQQLHLAGLPGECLACTGLLAFLHPFNHGLISSTLAFPCCNAAAYTPTASMLRSHHAAEHAAHSCRRATASMATSTRPLQCTT
jgi:hypothetical protein